MIVGVEHIDSEGERDYRDGGITHAGVEVLASPCGRGRIHVGRYCFDENHAQALVLALQAAIAEVQARAVSL